MYIVVWFVQNVYAQSIVLGTLALYSITQYLVHTGTSSPAIGDVGGCDDFFNTEAFV